MIFMHNETGHILEMMILSLDDIGEVCQTTRNKVFRVGEIQLHSQCFDGVFEMKMSDFYKHFTFIGFI
jgi:hypothetical protein